MCFALAMAVSLTAADAPATMASLADARATLERRFTRMDRDRNGYITPNEAPRVAQARCNVDPAADAPAPASQSWIQNFDGNGDQRVSPEEFISRSIAAEAATQTASAASE